MVRSQQLGFVLMIVLANIAGPVRAAPPVSADQKANFITLLQAAPHKEEFLTDEGVEGLAPHIDVLFALTVEDIASYDIYPFGALSRGLCDRAQYRAYGVAHFGDITHPTLKMLWAAMLFDAGTTSSEIVDYLRATLASKEQSAKLAELIGAGFETIKKRVLGPPSERQ